MSTKQNAQREISKRWGVRFTPYAKRCPKCGTKNYQVENKTHVCRACKQKESPSA
jgi:ribosomal protein L40E